MQREQALFDIHDLDVRFRVFRGILPVLDRANMSVHRGERIGLVGETGCGKSITMKAAIGILPMPPAEITQGEISLRGRDMLSLQGRELREARGQISLIPQDPGSSLNPVFKIGTQILDAIKYSSSGTHRSKRETRSLAIDILSEVGLPDPERNLSNYPIQLSGGMKQRVLIAMALVTDPILLIADEPTTALDVTIENQILNLMRDAVDRRNLSILIITHNLGVVRGFTNRLYIMYAGQIVEEAQTSALFRKTLHPYSRGLIESVPKLTGEGITEGIPGMVPDYLNVPDGCRFAPRCNHAMEICSKTPEMLQREEDRRVACFMYGQEIREERCRHA